MSATGRSYSTRKLWYRLLQALGVYIKPRPSVSVFATDATLFILSQRATDVGRVTGPLMLRLDASA